MDLRAVAGLIALAATWCGAREAAACWSVFAPGRVARPAFEPAGAARIESEEVDVDCGPASCEVVTTYRIAADAEARVTVGGFRTRHVAIEVDGAAAAIVRAGARELRVTTIVELWAYVDWCFREGIVARHPYLASEPPSAERVLVIETAARPRVRHPSGWSLELDQRGPEWDRVGKQPSARLWFRLPGLRAVHGGPFALAGIASGPGSLLRLRAGWEIAAPPWLVLALAADTDASSLATIAVTADATSRVSMLPLSLSIGGGPIVAVAPELRPGGRGQVSVALGPARLVVSVDVLAPSGRQPTATSVALLAGGSL